MLGRGFSKRVSYTVAYPVIKTSKSAPIALPQTIRTLPTQKPSALNGHSHSSGNGHSTLGNGYYLFMMGLTTLGVGYEIISGDAKKKIEETWYSHNLPTTGAAEFHAFEPHQKIPIRISQELESSTLSSKNNCKRIVICGEGGIGKLAAAMQIADALDAKNKEPHFRTIINLRGHTREEMIEDIIAAASRLGMTKKEPSFVEAKKFLADELQKRPGATIIVRCLREVSVLKEIENIISPPQILPQIPPLKVALIATTGDQNIGNILKTNGYDYASLDKSFTSDDLGIWPGSINAHNQPKDSVTRMLFARDVFQNNPTLGRIGLAYSRNNPTLNIERYKKNLDALKASTMEEAILRISLNELEKNYPLSGEILAMIAPKGVPQSAGLSVDALLKDSSLLDKVSGQNNPAQHIRETLDALEKYGLINVNASEGKIYQTILISQSNYLRGEPAQKSSFADLTTKATHVVNVVRSYTSSVKQF